MILGCSGASKGASTADDAKNGDAVDSLTDSLLGGRLRVRLPKNAVTAARPVSIMSAPPAIEDETRVVVEAGPPGERARFVLLATELYATSSGDVTGDASSLGLPARAFPCAEGLACAEVVPSEISKKTPVFIAGIVTKTPDGLLQKVEFFILEELRPEIAHYRQRAEAIAKTLAPGPRSLDVGGGDRRLGDDLVVTVPDRWVVTAQRGPDFNVYRIRKLVAADAPEPVLGVYIGGYPSTQAGQSDENPVVTSEAGRLVGQDVTWLNWKRRSGKRVREADAKLDDHTFVHAYAIGPDGDSAELDTIAASLRVAH